MNKRLKILGIIISATMLVGMVGVVPVRADILSVGQVKSIVSTHRLSGTNRYATANAIAQKGWISSDTVILASGEEYADALCAGPLAEKYNAPLLLTKSTGISDETLSELGRLKTKGIIIIGGTGAVSTNVENQLKSAGYTGISRIGGKTRYETATLVASKLDKANAVVIASGENFPDALSISSIASKLGMPILLSKKDGLSDFSKAYIKNNSIEKTYIVGGLGVLTGAIETQVPSPKRLGGSNRYATNLAIINSFETELNFDNVYLATGEDFADALSGSALAAQTSSPIILKNRALNSDANAYLKSKMNSKSNVVALGGKSVISDIMVQELIDIVAAILPENSIPTPPEGSGNNGNQESSASVVDLSDGESHTNNYTILSQGTYGHSSKTTTITGNIDINKTAATVEDEVILQNLNIVGDLTVNFGAGNVILNNVTVNGIIVKNVGASSLHIRGNSSIGLLTVNDTDNNAHIVVEEGANISNTTVLSGAKLEVATGTRASTHANPFENIKIAPAAAPTDDNAITLAGAFTNVTVAAATKLTLADNAIISNQLKINAPIELNVASNASITKVSIATANSTDKVVISGNLDNVDVSKDVDIEIKTGSVQIASSTNSVVKIQVDETATVTTGKDSNIDITGSGEVVLKANLSNDAVVIKSFDVENNNTDELYNIPAAITAKDLIDNIIVSPFATMSVVDDYSGKEVDGNTYITDSMKLRIVSGSGNTINNLSLNFEWLRGNLFALNGFGYDSSMHEDPYTLDTNINEGIVSTTIKFNKPTNETDVDGYFVGIEGSKIISSNNYDNKQLRNFPIYKIFVAKDSAANGKYSVNLKDINLKGYKIINLSLTPIINNKILSNYWGSIYDNPSNKVPASSEGIILSQFEDTNSTKGMIEGKVSFTKSTDESNTGFYRVMFQIGYSNVNGGPHNSVYEIGVVEPGDAVNGIYSITTKYPIQVGATNDITIQITPVSKAGLEANYNECVTGNINDNPADTEIVVEVPNLFADVSEDYRVNVSGALPGSILTLYKFDGTSFVPYVKNEKLVKVINWNNFSEFDKVEVGRYKVTQTAKGIETAKSEEVKVRPMRLSGVFQTSDSSLSLINAIDGSIIKVYDKNNNVIKTTTKEAGKTPVIMGLTTGLYYATQTVSGIESTKFVVPIGVDYTIDDINSSVVASFNAANLNASITGSTITVTKKNVGPIGEISIDTGADLPIHIGGDFDGNLMQKLFGVNYLENFKAATFTINSDYDTFIQTTHEIYVSATYNGVKSQLKIVFED
ncbi:cell wall-binding repeat-containing protein [Clostridium sp.]|uniref:cell wall-binding repeat-containing protein n=1 Tax=Clostridium sp. TaxID=1506 RepID=UPI003D6D723A